MSTQEQVLNFIQNDLGLDVQGIDTNTKLLEEQVVDSLSMLSLIAFIEKSFAVQVESSDLTDDNFGTIENIAAYIERKLAG